jgi:hypothetical protein
MRRAASSLAALAIVLVGLSDLGGSAFAADKVTDEHTGWVDFEFDDVNICVPGDDLKGQMRQDFVIMDDGHIRSSVLLRGFVYDDEGNAIGSISNFQLSVVEPGSSPSQVNIRASLRCNGQAPNTHQNLHFTIDENGVFHLPPPLEGVPF